MIRDYPFPWARRIDLLTPLPLQVAVDEKLELFFCRAEATIQEGKRLPPREIKTEQGTSIKAHPIHRRKIICEIGTPDPRNGISPIRQKDWHDDIIANIPEVLIPEMEIPDVVIKVRGVIEPSKNIPIKIEDLDIRSFEIFQASENIFYLQSARSNQIHVIRRRLGIWNLANPYHLARDFLLSNKIVTPTEMKILSKKMKSTLKTRWLITDAGGWGDLGERGILALEKALIQKKEWTDIGIPTPFQIPVNSGIRGQIYRLMRRNCLVVI